MIQLNAIMSLFHTMLKEHWDYVWGSAKKGEVDCSGAFVYAYKTLDNKSIGVHGSNWIARQECGEMLPMSEIKPGMAVFKKREPGDSKYALPARYKKGGKYYNGDLNDYYHIGMADEDTNWILNAQSTRTGFVNSPASQNWCGCAYLTNVSYDGKEEEEDEPMYEANVTAEKGSTVNMRKSPSTTATIVVKIPLGETVGVYEEADGWCKIKYNGTYGYMMTKFLEKIEGSDKDEYEVKEETDEDEGEDEEGKSAVDDEDIAKICEYMDEIREKMDEIEQLLGVVG